MGEHVSACSLPKIGCRGRKNQSPASSALFKRSRRPMDPLVSSLLEKKSPLSVEQTAAVSLLFTLPSAEVSSNPAGKKM